MVEAGRPLGPGQLASPQARPSPTTTSRRRCSTWPGRSSTSPATSASTRGHGPVRPAGHRGVPGRVGPHAGPHGAAVGQGRLRRGRAGEVRPARPGHAQRAALRGRPHRRGPRRRGRPGHDPPGGRGLRHVVPGRLDRGVPGREPGPDGHAAPASSPARSTTWWSRWRSSGPGRSRAGRCTPTSAAATARSRSPTCTRCSRSRWPRRWGCRCSRSSSCRWPSTWPGSSPGEADQLRQAMGSKRSRERMERLRARLYEGMAERGITGEVADQIFDKLAAFANFGFPESHSVSFAYLVYAELVDQAALPGRVLRRAAQRPADGLLLAALAGAGRPPPRRRGAHPRHQRLRRHRHPRTGSPRGFCVNVSRSARHIDGREPVCGWGWARCATWATTWPSASRPSATPTVPTAPWRTSSARVPLKLDVLEALATAGAFGGSDRAATGRRSIAAGRCGGPGPWPRPGRPPGRRGHRRARPALPGMTDHEVSGADLWATGVAPDGHPTRFVRHASTASGWCRRPGWSRSTTGRRCSSAGWSPIASDRPPRRASRSSTSRTRPA